MKQYLNKLLNYNNNKIPHCYRREFFEINIRINFIRQKIFSVVLIAWNGLMIAYTSFGAFNNTWKLIPIYKFQFYIHIIGFGFSSLFLWLFFIKSNIQKESDSVFRCLLSIAFVAFILDWAVALTIIDLIINRQFVIYSLIVIVTSFSLILIPKASMLIFLSTYIFLVIGTILTQNSPIMIESSIFNGFIIAASGIVISKVSYNLNIDNFLKRKTIQEKTAELEDTKSKLEKALLIRDEQLDSANEMLLKEINARHAMEIQVLRGDLEYQKNLSALNKAMEYDRLRGEFFANISHELRTPLNIIFSAIQLIDVHIYNDKTEIDKNKMKKHIKFIRQNCYRLMRLINNIIDITKIDSGYLNINLTNNDIVKIIKDITNSIAPYAICNQCTVEFTSELKEKFIAFDCDQIERIIINLLSNAIKFSSPKGKIYVNVYKSNDYVSIMVKDDGIGITKEMQKVIFDRFVQADKSTTRENEGSGIGLSLVKSLVKMHNGRISVNSESGKGSEFIIELPDLTVECDKDAAEYESNRTVCNTEIINMEFCDIYKSEIR